MLDQSVVCIASFHRFPTAYNVFYGGDGNSVCDGGVFLIFSVLLLSLYYLQCICNCKAYFI